MYNGDMSDDQFTNLFKYVKEICTEMNGRFDEAGKERDDISGDVAGLSAQVRYYHNESIFLNRHVDKLIVPTPPRSQSYQNLTSSQRILNVGVSTLLI